MLKKVRESPAQLNENRAWTKLVKQEGDERNEVFEFKIDESIFSA